jgi:hypothetical protein
MTREIAPGTEAQRSREIAFEAQLHAIIFGHAAAYRDAQGGRCRGPQAEPRGIPRKLEIFQSGEIRQIESGATLGILDAGAPAPAQDAIDIIAGPAEEDVFAGISHQRVASIATQQGVATFTSEQEIIPCAAAQPVGVDASLQRVVSIVAFEPIAAESAVEQVITLVTKQQILPLAPAQTIGRWTTMQAIIPDPAIQRVFGVITGALIPAMAREHIVAGAAVDDIRAAATAQMIKAIASEDVVVAIRTRDDVIAHAAIEPVRSGTTKNLIVAVITKQEIGVVT